MGFQIGQFFLDVISDTFIGLWEGFSFVLINGGWVLLACFLIWTSWYRYFVRKNTEFLSQSVAEWTFLNISIPDLPSESIKSAEQMFTQMHGTKKPVDWRQQNILGEQRYWFAFEIVSLGGAIRYIIRSPREDVESVKAAVFSQYPHAEIQEVGDYLEALKTPFGPDSDYDFWGADFKLDKMEAYPIKVFEHFEDRAAEMILDPLSGFLEVMAEIDPEEMMILQILASPDDDDWKKAGIKELEKLKGVKGAEGASKDENAPLSMMLHLSEGEKDVINAIDRKLSKLSYRSIVRVMYAAPKSAFKRKIRLSSMVGSIRQFTDTSINSLKQNMYTETLVTTRLSAKLEAKKVELYLLWKKRAFLKNFKTRDMWGGRKYHLSTEELASLFHFPLETARASSVDKIEARKGEPPINLPI